MRHKHKRVLELNTWIQKSRTVLRNMLTSLVISWNVTTTSKKSKALKSFTDSFFSRLVRLSALTDSAASKREINKYVENTLFDENAWKKVVNELLPKFIENKLTTSFVTNYKLGFRKWDWAEKVLVSFVTNDVQ